MSSFTKPGAFGAPGPLPGARTYKQSQSAKMVEEALIAEERLAKLRSEVEQKRKASAPSNGAGIGTGHWRAGQADRGSVRNYAKEVKTREQAKLAQQSHKLLQPRRQSLLELALARATVRTSVSAQSSGRPQASSSSEQASAAAEAQLVRPPSSGYMSKDVGAWDVQDTLEWLDMLGLNQHRECFSQNEISGPILLEVGQDDLDYMHITALAHRKQLLRGIDDLKRNGRPTSVVTALGTSKPAPAAAAAAAAAVPVAQQHQQQQQSAGKSKPAAEPLPAKVQHERCGTEQQQQQAQAKGSPKVTRHWSEVKPLSEQAVIASSSSSGAAQSANLADGSYDEAAASSAFTDAVMAWRRGSSSTSAAAATSAATTAKAAVGVEAPDSGMWCNPFATPRSADDDSTTATAATTSAATAGAVAKPRTGAARLLDGEVDEEAEAAAFKRAVAEWRSGSSSSTSGAVVGNDEPLASARPTTASDRTRAIAEALAQQMDAEHTKQARAFEARRQQLEQELQASSAAASAATAASSGTADDDDSVTLHDVSDDVSDDEAAALHTSVDHSQYDTSSSRDAVAAVGTASPTLSEAHWHSSTDRDEQAALHTDDDAVDSSSEQQHCTLEVSVLESTLGCSQQWQHSSAAAATAYTVQESDDEED
jgi:trimeric autotransporter adhesin